MPTKKAYSDGALLAVRPDGLRYESKPTGFSTFGYISSGAVMSCFKCGIHKSRNLGKVRRVFGANQFFCAECTKEREDALAAKAAAEGAAKPDGAGTDPK